MNKPETTVVDRSIALHRQNRGKIGISLKVPLESSEDLSLAYTPGVGGEGDRSYPPLYRS
jgi:malic enzyme